MIERVENESTTLAIIIRAQFQKDGIEFFTPDDYSQQLAYMNRPKGYRIQPHVHNEVRRDVVMTQEVLFIRSGRVMVDFYDQERAHVCDVVLETGDVILLAAGGHGFTMLEPSEMIEVKQGPYAGDMDKTRFEP
jgi:mannose-6-phosphate isomerase-like protein (cupin superfamily)